MHTIDGFSLPERVSVREPDPENPLEALPSSTGRSFAGEESPWMKPAGPLVP